MSDGLTEALLELAKHPEGIRACDKRLKAWPYATVDRRVAKLVKELKLHRAALSPKNVRYFVDARDAALALRDSTFSKRDKPKVPPSIPAGWGGMPAITTSRTRYSVGPSHPDKFREIPLPTSIVSANQRGRVFRD